MDLDYLVCHQDLVVQSLPFLQRYQQFQMVLQGPEDQKVQVVLHRLQCLVFHQFLFHQKDPLVLLDRQDLEIHVLQ